MLLASVIAVTVAFVGGTCDGAAPWIMGSLLRGGLGADLALGFGRMAAGGRFLSDVLWSALLAFGVCHLLYVHALRLHRIDESIAAAGIDTCDFERRQSPVDHELKRATSHV